MQTTESRDQFLAVVVEFYECDNGTNSVFIFYLDDMYVFYHVTKTKKVIWGKTVLKIKGCRLPFGSSVPQGRI